MAKSETQISINMFVSDSEEAFNFYRHVFGARSKKDEIFFNTLRGGKSCLFSIGTQMFALADEKAELGTRSPLTLGGTPFCIQIFVEDVAEVMNRALDFGAKLTSPSDADTPIVTVSGTQFGNIEDPFGYIWSVTRY